MTHIAINVIIPYVVWWFRAEKGSIGRQKWDPGEKNVKIHIVLEVKSKMYQNIQKYLKMCKIENHINYCVFLMILSLFPIENRSNPYFYRLKRTSRNSPAESPEVVSGSAAQTPPPHAPGARMTWVKQTPSNYIMGPLYYIILILYNI